MRVQAGITPKRQEIPTNLQTWRISISASAEADAEARRLTERAVSFFARVETEAVVVELRTLALNRIRVCWYEWTGR